MKAEMKRRQSNTEKVLDLFRTKPKVWIRADAFIAIAGSMAWRTRISDARKILEAEGGVVENRCYTRKAGAGDAFGDQVIGLTFVVSEYRYLPYEPLGRDAGTLIDRVAQGALRF